MTSLSIKNRLRLKVAVIAAASILAATGIHTSNAARPRAAPFEGPIGNNQADTANGRTAVSSSQRYSKFSHDVAAHKIDCGKCHKFPSDNWKKVREGDAAFPDVTDYPKHASCINCHRRQFFQGTSPAICSICHTNPGPRNSARHPFANPREIFDRSPKGRAARSEFEVYFPHDIHVDMISEHSPARSGFIAAAWTRSPQNEESCAVCHQTIDPQGDGSEEYFAPLPDGHGDAFWLKKGTFKSSPIGHTTCFTCHSEDGGIEPAPTNCAVCHRPRSEFAPDFDPTLAVKMGVTERRMLDAWRTRASAGTFRHEFFSHAEMSCSDCHNVSAMVTTDFRTRKVPVASCSNCHITATADDGGILNYEIDARRADPAFQCTKCHVTYGKQPIPDSHLKAIAALAGN
jgi:hypothetical protein